MHNRGIDAKRALYKLVISFIHLLQNSRKVQMVLGQDLGQANFVAPIQQPYLYRRNIDTLQPLSLYTDASPLLLVGIFTWLSCIFHSCCLHLIMYDFFHYLPFVDNYIISRGFVRVYSEHCTATRGFVLTTSLNCNTVACHIVKRQSIKVLSLYSTVSFWIDRL